MPKIVDHQERRRQIADALMRVVGSRGLEGISLRHVAAECGVTAGMVQHYFPTKDAMMTFAMESATARYAVRMAAAVEQAGTDASPVELVRGMLRTLLPMTESERADARVALAFLSHAATQPAAAADLDDGNADLRSFLGEQVLRARESGASGAASDPEATAAGLLAMAEGLGIQLLTNTLTPEAACAALDAQLDLVLGAR